MENAAILAGIGVGTVATGAGIAVVSSGGNSINFEKIILNGSYEIISKYRELSCVKDLFPTITWNANPNSTQTKTSITNKTIALKADQTEGCISVRWQREKYNNHWRGAWNLIWGMRDDQNGTLFVSTIMADLGRVHVDRYVYVIQKQGEKWTTTGKWFKDKESVTSTNQSSLIVKFKDSLSGPNNNLVDIEVEANSVCPDTTRTCKRHSANISFADLSWKYKRGEVPTGGKQASEWNTKINDWIKNGTSLDINLENVYTNITSGHYELEKIVHG